MVDCTVLYCFVFISGETMSDKKRKRVVLSLQQKLEIIDRLEKGISVQSLASEYNVGEQTVRDIRKKKTDLMKFTSCAESSIGLKKRKTMKKSTYESLDMAMLEWFTQQRALGNPISGVICTEKAKLFFESLGIEGKFDASSGWLYRFKQRHGIRELDIQGEILSGDKDAAEEFVADFNKFVESENLLPEQIFNTDESGLYWKCLPTKTLAFQTEKNAPGHKVSKERLTILTCSNASGTKKLKMVVIGKAKKPRSFKGTEAKNLPVLYYNQKKGWMNQLIFGDWFKHHFVPQVKDYLKAAGLPEKAVLVLDNAPSHPSEASLKSDDGKIFVKYLPPNVTALIQPMDQGVIASFKKMYRTDVLRKLIEEENDLKTFLKKFTILDAIYESASAWEKVKKTTLIRAWKKIFPDIDDGEEFSGFSQESIMSAEELAKMAVEVPGGEQVDADNIISWFECDIDLPAFEQKSDEDIIRSVMEGEGDAVSEGEEDEEEGEGASSQTITHSAALLHVESLLDYIEGQDDALLSDKIVLRKLRSQIMKKQQSAKKQTTMKDFFKSN